MFCVVVCFACVLIFRCLCVTFVLPLCCVCVAFVMCLCCIGCFWQCVVDVVLLLGRCCVAF